MVPRTRIAALLLFGSGFCALIYQTTWLREFRLIFGASTAASAAVLGVFMAGLGFGGIILGRRSEAKARPLAFYAQLEFFIALSAAISPFLILVSRHLYIAFGGTEAMGIVAGTIVRLLLATVILGVPTFLMGGTLPAVARAVVSSDDTSRRSLGVLYGVNTLGAVSGALAGTFYLFENFGNHLTLWWAAGLNVIVAFIALRFSKTMGDVSTTNTSATDEIEGADESSIVSPGFVFVAAGIVGFAFFLMEMVWYRMLAPLLGGSTFSFGLILAVALLGIGLGGVIYAFFNLKSSASIHLFALTCAAEALFIAVPYALGDRIAIMAMLLRPLGTLGFYGHVMAWTALCSIVIFPAAFVSGLQFPLLIALLGKGSKSVGSQTGAAYSWNTIGALIGSLAGGFGFIPMFSALGVWKLVVILLALLAIIAASLAFRQAVSSFRTTLIPISIAAVALLLLAAMGPTAFWRHSQIGIGGLRNSYHASPNEMRDLLSGTRRRVMWQADGRESGVAVANADGIAFIVNGKSDGNAKADAGTQIMSAIIGAALHPNPQKALVVGLGTGSTAGWLSAVSSMQRVDAIELERAILKVAELCAPVNHNALANPKLHIKIGDGREFLLTTKEKYDLVISEPSNPYRAGVAGLFTREFYQSVDRRLEHGGLFLQWVQTYDVDDRTIEIFYRTLGSVFEQIESWQTEEGDLLLIASHEPIAYDVSALRQRLGQEPFRSALNAAWGADGLEDFVAHYVGNANVARTLQQIQEWPLNTDDRTVIEFAFARSVSSTNGFNMPSFRSSSRAAHCDRPEHIQGEIDWDRVQEARMSNYIALTRTEQTQMALTAEQTARTNAFADYTRGNLLGALRSWHSQTQEPRTLPQLAMVAESLAEAGDDSALKYIKELAEKRPSDAEAIRCELLRNQGKKEDAIKSMETFLLAARKDPWPEQGLIRRSLARTELLARNDSSNNAARSFFDALRGPLAIWNCEGDRLARLLTLGMHADGDKIGPHTGLALAPFEPNVMWEKKFLQIRKAFYIATNDSRASRADRDLNRFMTDEAFTADVSALTRALNSAPSAGAYATEVDRSASSPKK
ncbi:MAG: fused MFS/spermidine synthase [Verrucomicrobiota bacterium]